jgi:hypothetical protein
MGISDVLFDSAEDIRAYMRAAPAAYADVKPRVDQLLKEMDAVRIELDAQPAPDRGSNAPGKSPSD